MDVFLASGLVPAYTAAAFAKRFARLALAAPPAGACVALAFVHNLLRRHPACNVLLHRHVSPPSIPYVLLESMLRRSSKELATLYCISISVLTSNLKALATTSCSTGKAAEAWLKAHLLRCRPSQRTPATANDAEAAGAVPDAAGNTAEAHNSTTAAPAGSSPSDEDFADPSGAGRHVASAQDKSEDSDDSATDEENDGAASPVANGHASRLANGHAHGPQPPAPGDAQRAGRPPDAAFETADQVEHPEQQPQPPQPPQPDATAGVDLFVEDEPDPAKARALESSLWEVASLRNHYCQQASCRRVRFVLPC